MSLHINYFNESNYIFDHIYIRQILENTVREKGVDVQAEINVYFVNTRDMANLHARFLGTRKATDVLSFPLHERREIEVGLGTDPDGVLRLGEIVICADIAQKQARENHRSEVEEMGFLARHGCLHLLGRHHPE